MTHHCRFPGRRQAPAFSRVLFFKERDPCLGRGGVVFRHREPGNGRIQQLPIAVSAPPITATFATVLISLMGLCQDNFLSGRIPFGKHNKTNWYNKTIYGMFRLIAAFNSLAPVEVKGYKSVTNLPD
jgi:hypothetical protein